MARRHPTLALLALCLAAALAAAAAAKSLDELRKEGTVGERFDGFAALHQPDAPAEVKAQVKEINQKRQEIYDQRAREEKVPADQVGRVYAKKIYDEAPSGTWFLTEKEEWVRKK